MISDQAIKGIKDIESLLHFLRDKLDWPIEDEDLETLTYEYYPEELGLDSKYDQMISTIRQLRPLVEDQPWGIFFLDFQKKNLPVGALRKILSGLVFSKRRNTEHAVWDKSELLFICSLKDEDNLIMGFVHFKDSDTTVPSINTFYWDVIRETNFNFKSKLERLAWPDDMSKTDEWKQTWSRAFTIVYRETIGQSKQLVEQLAELAQNTRQRVLETYLVESSKGALHKLFSKFQELLIHDISILNFADMYAQTVAYGLFSARCMDTDGHFQLSEVVERIPTTNPFLKQLLKNCFEHGLGNSTSQMFDELAIGEIVDLLDHTDTKKILDDWGRQTGSGSEDPVIHFYEGFLDAYEHEQKKRRGVYYTPDPVVSFIVRSVDEILCDEFGYTDGLADISTKTIEYQRESKRQKRGVQTKYVTDTIEVPAIQILDPATGTGTFLAHTIRQIKANFDRKHKGKSDSEIHELWNEYVPEHLLPRLNGFEIMMAPYSVAHMKLGLVLKETGYDFKGKDRLNVYLTNTLEEAGNEVITLFDLLSAEAVGANKIKNNTGISVVIGNPPYSVSSSNKNEWIEYLMADYKKDMQERNIQPLSDDYIKFIRFGEYAIDKTNGGILAYISNNSFIDGLIHRQMRKHLLETFDKIYILDLHGSSKKKEICPDGSPDQNVFDIQQGVSINIFIRTSAKKTNEIGQVYHFDMQGRRDVKNDNLSRTSLNDIDWEPLNSQQPNYFFINKNYDLYEDYKLGFSTNDLFINGSSGIKTERDSLTIHFTKDELKELTEEMVASDCETFRKNKKVKPDGRDWKLSLAQKDLIEDRPKLIKIMYRPFDCRYTYYTGKTKGFHAYPRSEITPHFIDKLNYGLIHLRLNNESEKYVILITNIMTEKGSLVCGNYFISPLYLYSQANGHKNIHQLGQNDNLSRKPNLNQEIVNILADKLCMTFTIEKNQNKNTFAPIDILDYIYAILNSPSYRDKYKEFLKIDFPIVPYPEDAAVFWELVRLGGELRETHLMKNPLIKNHLPIFPLSGSNRVEKISYQDEMVRINKKQYFENVSLKVWEFYIGGYQPAQKWLKDRKGRILNNEEIEHYLSIIGVIVETDRIMKEIDEITDFE